jgi:hypothetical protein
MTITLTQMLTRHRTVRLYGNRIADINPRGDLGLGLDPEGPVAFALIRAFHQAGHTTVLAEPAVLSVHGDGQAAGPDDPLAQADEQVWTAASTDAALRLELQQAPLQAILLRLPALP